jgi:hypothetical protein
MGGGAYADEGAAPQPEKKPEVVPMTKEAIQAYLDKAITSWRESKEEHAKYYVDAFQSVRVSLIGELLAEKEA